MTRIAERAWLAAIIMLAALLPASARAQGTFPDGWLGLWCSDDDRIAVINFGVDPDAVLAAARAQLPQARTLIAARTRLVPPRHNGACVVPAVGSVRVTTYGRSTYDMSRHNFCELGTTNVAWIGPRRVLDRRAEVCGAYALIVTTTAVLHCGALSESQSYAPDYVLEPLTCSVWGAPTAIGRLDGSMFAPDGAPRPREGFALRYSERPGACEPFIALPQHALGFALERGRLVPRRMTQGWDDPLPDSGVAWTKLDALLVMDVSIAAFDFLGRGKPDVVFRVRHRYSSRVQEFVEDLYLIFPGRGGDLEAIAERVTQVWQGFNFAGVASSRSALLSAIDPLHEVILVDATGIADFPAAKQLGVVRDGAMTYTVLLRDFLWAKEGLAIVLSRVEKDGRQTPVCMYDRSRPPPHAAW